jgi:hypothetical protein
MISIQTMVNIRIIFTLVLVFTLMASSLILIPPAASSDIPTPSVPQFTVKLVDCSYDVPQTTSVDPYNGKTITHPGYHVDNLTLQIQIKNPLYTPITLDGAKDPLMYYYNIRTKGHFEEQWYEIFSAGGNGYLKRCDGAQTIYTTQVECDPYGFKLGGTQYPPDAQFDYQVQALIGVIVDNGPFTDNPFSEEFVGESSGWSSTQTFSASQYTSAPTPLPSQPITDSSTPLWVPVPTPTPPQADTLYSFNWSSAETFLVILFVVIAGLLILVVVCLRKRAPQ